MSSPNAARNLILAVSTAAAFLAASIAEPPHSHASATTTVDGTDYPLCAEEDCSDQPAQTGVWRNDGRTWLIVGDATYPVTP